VPCLNYFDILTTEYSQKLDDLLFYCVHILATKCDLIDRLLTGHQDAERLLKDSRRGGVGNLNLLGLDLDAHLVVSTAGLLASVLPVGTATLAATMIENSDHRSNGILLAFATRRSRGAPGGRSRSRSRRSTASSGESIALRRLDRREGSSVTDGLGSLRVKGELLHRQIANAIRTQARLERSNRGESRGSGDNSGRRNNLGSRLRSRKLGLCESCQLYIRPPLLK
jgi:hypothetical protein